MIRALPAILAMLVMAACTGGSSEDTAEAPTGDVPTTMAPPTTAPPGPKPDCADVWVDGKQLSKDYAGCVAPEGAIVSDVEKCVDGSSFATYTEVKRDVQTPYFAKLGGRVVEYTDNEFGPYAEALGTCQG